jgi:hypothetical protein
VSVETGAGLVERIAERRAGVGDPAELVAAVREEDIEKQSWGDVFTPDSLHPDYSADSWKKAGHEMAQTWKDTGRSLLTEGQGGAMSDLGNKIAGVDDKEFNRDLDRVFGPSPEERAAQQQDQGQGQDGGK